MLKSTALSWIARYSEYPDAVKTILTVASRLSDPASHLLAHGSNPESLHPLLPEHRPALDRHCETTGPVLPHRVDPFLPDPRFSSESRTARRQHTDGPFSSNTDKANNHTDRLHTQNARSDLLIVISESAYQGHTAEYQ